MNDLSLHILDITQNSISAGATLIRIVIDENINRDLLTITIEDNGKGMSKEMLKSVTDPFTTSRSTRKVGLGLPLFKQSAVQAGGDLVIESEEGKGTIVTATFQLSHIDRPPMGDIANILIILVSSNPNLEFWFRYIYDNEEYIFDTVEVKEALDGMAVNNPQIIKYLTELVEENIFLIKKEEKNEK